MNRLYILLGFRIDTLFASIGTHSWNLRVKETDENPDLTITLTIDTSEPAEYIQSFFIHEALRHNTEVITDEDVFYSEYFGSTSDGYAQEGDAYNYVEANGYRVRGYSVANNTSLKSRLSSLQAIFGIGWGIERAYQGGEFRLRVEPYSHWYVNQLMLEFDDVVDYKEEFLDWFSFNEVSVGYNTYSGDKEVPGTIEDIFTYTSYILPAERLRGVKTYHSDYIASDVLLEITRRKQFDLVPTESWKYDDNLFILDVQADPYYGWEQGSANSDEVIGSTNAINFNKFINPRFNFFNHWLLINSVTYKKPSYKSYINTFYKNTGDIKIGYSTTNPTDNKIGDLEEYTSGTVPALKSDISISQLRGGYRLFDPIKVSYKVGLSDDNINTLIEGHRGGLASANNGFLRVTDPDGNIVDGWLLEASFNYNDKIIDIEMIKKADDYLV